MADSIISGVRSGPPVINRQTADSKLRTARADAGGGDATQTRVTRNTPTAQVGAETAFRDLSAESAQVLSLSVRQSLAAVEGGISGNRQRAILDLLAPAPQRS